jgi:hypothetical protein
MAFEGFYPAILATFRHIESTYGRSTLERYWRELALEYYGPVIERFRAGGLDAVAEHFREYFSREPNAAFDVVRQGVGQDARVIVDVERCPAKYWLRHFGCEVPDWYDDLTRVMGETMAQRAGFRFQYEPGCDGYRMTFTKGPEA